MSAFLAIFRDAWRESLDRRSVQVLVLIGLVLALFCASLSFGTPDPDRALADHSQSISTFTRRIGFFGGRSHTQVDAPHETGAVRAPQPEDDLPAGIEGARVVELRFHSTADVDDLARAWRTFRSRHPWTGDAPEVDHARAIGSRERADFFRERLEEVGFADVIARPIDGDERAWRVAAACPRPIELVASWTLHLSFGAFKIDVDEVSPAEWIVAFELFLANVFVGFFGMLVLLSTFASAVPEMVRKGSIDLVLARPIGRTRLLLFRYGAAVASVVALATVVFGACAAALWLRSGLFNVSFVACALTAAAAFAMLFPVALLLGVATRNTSLATLGSIGFWGLSSAVVQAREGMRMMGVASTRWLKVLDAVYWIAPKTRDLDHLNEFFLAHSNLSPAAAARAAAMPGADVNAWYSCGTSALFAAIVLALTVWVFRRRDW